MTQSFSKIWIIIILIILIAGGILAWQYFGAPQEEKVEEEAKPEEKQINKEEGFFFRLLSPKGGGELFIGKTYEIKWESRWLPEGSIKGVSIHLADPANDYNIATVYNPSGEYTWKISGDLRPGPHYQICIVAIMPEEILETLASPPDDCSELFTISEETAGWKTYRNEEHGFEVKHPGDWIIETYTDEINFGEKKTVEAAGNITLFKVGFTIKYYQDKSKLWDNEEELLFLEDWLSKNFLPLEEGETKKVITFGIGNYQGILVEEYKSVGVIKIIPRIFTQRGDAIYEFQGEIPALPTSGEFFPTDYDYDKVFEQMLSTFRFLEAEKPYVEVISPNGGEEWMIGKVYKIKWKAGGVSLSDYNFAVDLLIEDNLYYKNLFVTSSTEIIWVIPSSSDYPYFPPANNYRIQVRYPSAPITGLASDKSDNYFSIER